MSLRCAKRNARRALNYGLVVPLSAGAARQELERLLSHVEGLPKQPNAGDVDGNEAKGYDRGVQLGREEVTFNPFAI